MFLTIEVVMGQKKSAEHLSHSRGFEMRERRQYSFRNKTRKQEKKDQTPESGITQLKSLVTVHLPVTVNMTSFIALCVKQEKHVCPNDG